MMKNEIVDMDARRVKNRPPASGRKVPAIDSCQSPPSQQPQKSGSETDATFFAAATERFFTPQVIVCPE